MQLSAFPKGYDRSLKQARKNTHWTPSRGPTNAWVWIKDRYYLRTNRGQQLRGISKGMSTTLRAQLEQRNRVVQRVRIGLVLALVIGAALLLLTGCEPVQDGTHLGNGLVVNVDAAHGVACYHSVGSLQLSCVKVVP